MDFTQEEIIDAIVASQHSINTHNGETTYGVNDCYSLVREYDKALRGGHTDLPQLDYKNDTEFEEAVLSVGYTTLHELAVSHSYTEITNKRPRVGDVAYVYLTDGTRSLVIADKKRWFTATGSKGIRYLNQWSFIERKIPLITRPYRS